MSRRFLIGFLVETINKILYHHICSKSTLHERVRLPAVLKKGSEMSFVNNNILTPTNILGALPPPDMLKAYEAVIPGAAARILELAEVEQKRQIENEKKSLENQYYRLGVIVSFVSYALVIASILIYAVSA